MIVIIAIRLYIQLYSPHNQSINQHELAMAPHIQSSKAPEIK